MTMCAYCVCACERVRVREHVCVCAWQWVPQRSWSEARAAEYPQLTTVRAEAAGLAEAEVASMLSLGTQAAGVRHPLAPKDTE